MQGREREREERESERKTGVFFWWVGRWRMRRVRGGGGRGEQAPLSQNHSELFCEVKMQRVADLSPGRTFFEVFQKVTASSTNPIHHRDGCTPPPPPSVFEKQTRFHAAIFTFFAYLLPFCSRAPLKSFQTFAARVVKKKTRRECAGSPGSRRSVTPQYAQTNLKQARCIKARSI